MTGGLVERAGVKDMTAVHPLHYENLSLKITLKILLP